ncbi:MAG: DUF7144 family membrane protein [Ktedonobacterales bacterium]
MTQVSHTLARRPGLVTFAAIMLFVLGGLEVIWAIEQFANAIWIGSTTYGTFGGYLWLWGILDVLLAAVAFYAGYDVLRGGAFGQVVGTLIASISAIRWFFYIPAAPWMAAVILTIDVLIIYGLVAHSDYFGVSSDQ